MPPWGFPNILGIVKGGMYGGYIGVYMDTKGQNCATILGVAIIRILVDMSELITY